MPADQNHAAVALSGYSAELQDALDLLHRAEAEEGAHTHQEEVLAPSELCGLDEDDGPCLRSESGGG